MLVHPKLVFFTISRLTGFLTISFLSYFSSSFFVFALLTQNFSCDPKLISNVLTQLLHYMHR